MEVDEGPDSGQHDQGRGDQTVRVLVAVNGSDHSMKAAEFLAGILPSALDVRLLGVIGYEFNPVTPKGPLTEAQERLSNDPKPELNTADDAKRIWQNAGAEVSSVRRYGHPSEQILLEAEEWGANMIVVGHHQGPASWFFGSVAEALVRNSSLPLLIVPSVQSTAPAGPEYRGG
jgi:nucleotide-binding universal stress UspA family protein